MYYIKIQDIPPKKTVKDCKLIHKENWQKEPARIPKFRHG
jgi:hypothetical protein